MATAVEPRAFPTPRRAIITPWADVLLSGGLSILVIVPILVLGLPALEGNLSQRLFVAHALLNFPHFMASAWLLYRSREIVNRHRWASIWLPLGTGVLCVGALALAGAELTPWAVSAVLLASYFYLAWHYTGQAWGMIASFAFLDGVAFEPRERRWLRASLRLMLAFHVGWVAVRQAEIPFVAAQLRPWSWVLVVLLGSAALVGVGGFAMLTRRLGRLPPLRIVVPWVAIVCWYALIARYPRALVLAQLSHAVQYLAFPARMEINRARARGSDVPSGFLVGAVAMLATALMLFFILPQLGLLPIPVWHRVPTATTALGVVGVAAMAWLWSRPASVERAVGVRLLCFGVFIVLSGCLLFWFAPRMATATVTGLFDLDSRAVRAAAVVVAFLNIHHYFTDGVLWRIHTPEVRQELFAHVRAPG